MWCAKLCVEGLLSCGKLSLVSQGDRNFNQQVGHVLGALRCAEPFACVFH